MDLGSKHFGRKACVITGKVMSLEEGAARLPSVNWTQSYKKNLFNRTSCTRGILKSLYGCSSVHRTCIAGTFFGHYLQVAFNNAEISQRRRTGFQVHRLLGTPDVTACISPSRVADHYDLLNDISVTAWWYERVRIMSQYSKAT